MLRLTHVSKTYRQGKAEIRALQDVSLAIGKGQIFGVIGPSGAGKSTLLRCINLLEKPDRGEVWVDGRDCSSLDGPCLRQMRRSIGLIFQHFNLLSTRTVAGNVAFPLEIAGIPRRMVMPRVKELLALVGLETKANAYPRTLSGGEKQRVGIARALANHPKVLLADEATSALDPETTGAILALLRRINRELGLTVVLITHEMAVVKEICDQVAVLEEGRLVEHGPVVDVFASPRAPLTKRFIQGLFAAELPTALLRRPKVWVAGDGGTVLARLSFIGQAAEEPVISETVRRFSLNANILSGHIDRLGETPYGRLLVEFAGERSTIEAALQHLKARGLLVELLPGREVATC